MGPHSGGAVHVITEILNLGRLLDRLAAGKLRVPRFQRPFVWQPRQMIELLDSIRRQYPIGSILLWDSSADLESLDCVGPMPVGPRAPGETSYILDGHQRLSTLLGTLRPNSQEWKWQVYFDLQEEKFFHPRSKKPPRLSIAASKILDTFAFLEECRRISNDAGARSTELVAKAERLADVFINYQLPVVRLTDADLSSAVRIFTRLNSKGSRVAPDAMISALTYRPGSFHLSAEIDSLQESLAVTEFSGISRMTILRTVLAAAGADIYDTDWTMLVEESAQQSIFPVKKKPRLSQLPDPPKLQRAIAECQRTIPEAVEFLKSEGIVSDRLLPYSLQFVLVAEFFRNCHAPHHSQLEQLKRWLWSTSFTGHLAAFSSTDARQAIEEIRALARGTIESIDLGDKESLPFPARMDSRSARCKAFLLFLASLEPCSLSTYNPLRVTDLLTRRSSAPYRKILTSGLEQAELSSPANCLLLELGPNASVSASILQLPDKERRRVCESHGITTPAFENLRAGKHVDFLALRKDWLMDEEQRFMSIKGAPQRSESQPEDTIDTDLDDLFGDDPPF